MFEKGQAFSCAEVLAKEIKKMHKIIVCLILLSVLTNIATAVAVAKYSEKKIYHAYFLSMEALENIHNVQIDYGKVTPAIKDKQPEEKQ